MNKEGNAISFAGNLTDDPELRHTEAGIARATFRAAVSGRRYSEPSFFAVVIWRDQAEHAAESLSKGSAAGHRQVRHQPPGGQGAPGYQIITQMIPDMGYRFLNPAIQGFDVRKPRSWSTPATGAPGSRFPTSGTPSRSLSMCGAGTRTPSAYTAAPTRRCTRSTGSSPTGT